MGRVDRQRRENRVDLGVKKIVEEAVLGVGQFLPTRRAGFRA